MERRKIEAYERKNAKVRETEERRVRRETERLERADKRKRDEEEKQERKRLREEKKTATRKSVKQTTNHDFESRMATVLAEAYVCDICGVCGHGNDEENGIEWFGCDGCERWFHDGCLSVSEVWSVRTSLVEQVDWVCKMCSPTVYEE